MRKLLNRLKHIEQLVNTHTYSAYYIYALYTLHQHVSRMYISIFLDTAFSAKYKRKAQYYCVLIIFLKSLRVDLIIRDNYSKIGRQR